MEKTMDTDEIIRNLLVSLDWMRQLKLELA